MIVPLGFDAASALLTNDGLRSFAAVTGGDLHSSIPSMAVGALEKWTGRATLLVCWLRETEIRALWV